MTRNECNRLLRVTLGIGQRELAKEIGVTPMTVCNYERGIARKYNRGLERLIEDVLDEAVEKVKDGLLRVVCETYQYGRKKGY